MDDEVYEYLKEYGFSHQEIDNFLEENDKMYYADIPEISKNITFLNNKGLNQEEIKQVLIKDPYMMTVKNNRLEALDKILIEELGYDSSIIKSMVIKNPDVYISSPIDLQKNIDYLKNINYNLEQIRRIFIDNPILISMTPGEFNQSVMI